MYKGLKCNSSQLEYPALPLVTRSHFSSTASLGVQQVAFPSIKFDQRLISAGKMIKISICFIVEEVRPAGTRSHSAPERERERQKDRQPKKERGEREKKEQ